MDALEKFANESGIFLAAHRGASGSTTENTLAAYKMAIEQGAVMVEADIRLSQDDVPYSYHDDESMSEEGDKLNLFEMDYVQACKALSANLPQLNEIVETVRDKAYLMIEIKSDFSPQMPERCLTIVKQIEQAGYMEHTLFGSFDYNILAALGAYCPGMNLAAIRIPGDTTELPALKAKLGIKAFVCSTEECTPTLMEEARAADIMVGVYGINSVKSYQEMISMGIKCVVTDYPGRIKQLME